MRKHMVSLAFVVLVVAGAVWFVVETPAHHGPAAAKPAPAAATAKPAPAAPPATAAKPAPAAAPLDPAAPRTVAEGRAALARLTPAERAELAPLARAFEAAARAAAGDHADHEPRPKADTVGPFPVTRSGIQAAVKAAVPQLKGCYDPWLKLNPTAGGRVVTGFHIGTPGAGATVARVTEVKVTQGGLGNRFLDGCVLSVLSGLRFQDPGDPEGVTVNYPLIFSPSKAAAKAAHGAAQAKQAPGGTP